MARKSRTSAEKLMAHDEKKAALEDYARASEALRDKSARLQALRLAQETNEDKDGEEPDTGAATPPPATKTSGAKTKRAAKSKSASLIWKS